MKIKTRTQKDFAWVNWTPEQINDAADKIIAKTKEDLEKIKAIPKEERTFENTIYAGEVAGEIKGLSGSFLGVLMHMSPKKEQRDTCVKAMERVQKASVDLMYDPKLYSAFKEYNPKKEKFEEWQKIAYKDTKKFFEKAGFHLSDDKQKELNKIRKEISALENKFEKNISDFQIKVLCNEKDLEGMPNSFIAMLETDKKTGKKIVNQSYPLVGPFMQYANSDKKRKELADKVSQQGGKKNLVILKKAVELRHKKAKLIGYKNHTDLVVEDRLSKGRKNIMEFLESTAKEIKPKYVSRLKEVDSFKSETLGKKGLKTTYFDAGYYGNLYSEKKWGIDNQEVKEYFELNNVKDQMFKLFGGLFGVSFKETKSFKLWHKDVTIFDVVEKGKVMGHLALDMFPREGKYSHMACWTFMKGRFSDFSQKEYLAPFCMIMGNFPKAAKGHPSLLSIREVETLFHEFGHACHGLLTRAPISSQSGTSVDFDFVETPSQLFENWIYAPEVLKKISKHYKTGKSLPKEIMDILIKKHFSSVAMSNYQVFVKGLVDQGFHSGRKIDDLNSYTSSVEKKYGIRPSSPKSLFPAGWGHMCGGYDSGYYGYMYSLVLAYDFFSRFEKDGPLNKKTGKALRKVLEKGGSEDEMTYIKEFLGRKPNNKAFLKALGIK